MDFRDRAACRGLDTNLFFPVGTPGAPAYDAQVRAAKAVCVSCPVRRPCGLWALEHPELADGVFGGMDGPERLAALRDLPRAPAWA